MIYNNYITTTYLKNTASQQYEFRWNKDLIIIPVLSTNVESYLKQVTCDLYRDGSYLSCTNITYSYDFDKLYSKNDIKTCELGTYLVRIKASDSYYRPGTCKNYKQLVTVKVIDDKPPVITCCVPKISISSRTSKIPADFNFRKYFTVTDFDKNPKVEIIPLLNNIVKCVATDSSNNTSCLEVPYEVIKAEAYLIVSKCSYISLDYNCFLNKQYNLKDYLYIEQINTEKEIPDEEYKNVCIDHFDIVPDKAIDIKISYKGDYLNSSILLVDNLTPTIEFFTDKIELDYTANFSDDFLKSFVKSCIGVDGSNLIDSVVVSHNLMHKVYDSFVTFSVNQEYNKKIYSKKQTLKVSLRSKIQPIIELKECCILIHKEVELKDYIVIKDPSDNNVLIDINKENLDIHKCGTYYVPVKATNSSGLSTNSFLTVKVLNSEKEIEEKKEKKESKKSIVKYIAISVAIVLFVVGVSLVTFFLKRKKMV